MNFNNLLIKKIDRIIVLTKEFDDIFKEVINLPDEQISETNINNIFTLTKNYIFIRSEHGSILLMYDKLKTNINSSITELNDDSINKLYDLSSFSSIISNVSDLINNIDFQYKKIALKYPKFINKNPTKILLFVDSIDNSNEYVKLINDVKDKCPNNIYKIIKCENSGSKIKCDDIIGINGDFKVKKIPSIFIINGSIVEIPIEIIDSPEKLINLLK